jgi:putative endonuclease
MKHWYVYILQCQDGSLYTGVTIDIERRLHEHNFDNRLGAKYTRARRPVFLQYRRCFASRAAACRHEHEIKAMKKQQKIQLIASQGPVIETD